MSKMLIVYEGAHEVLVCRPKDEKLLLKDYFSNGGRDLEQYDRLEVKDSVVQIESGYLKAH